MREVGGSQGRLDALSGVLGVVVSLVLVAVFTFFMLLKREDFRNRLFRLSGQGHLHLMTQAIDDTSRRVSRYLSLQALVNTSFGLIIFVALHFIRLPHALLWGALAGLLRFIPYIGAPIGALLPTALSLAVFNGWTKTLLIMAIFFCLEISHCESRRTTGLRQTHRPVITCNSGSRDFLGSHMGTDRPDLSPSRSRSAW